MKINSLSLLVAQSPVFLFSLGLINYVFGISNNRVAKYLSIEIIVVDKEGVWCERISCSPHALLLFRRYCLVILFQFAELLQGIIVK